MLDYDLSDPGVVPLQIAAGDYSVSIDQPSAGPSFTFSPGDVIHMHGQATFNELFGGNTALLVFTSFREAPSVACGAEPPPPRIPVSPGSDLDPGGSTHQGAAVVSQPNGTICSSELDEQPFLTLIFEDAIEGAQRDFAFDLVLDGPMNPNGGMRVLYKGYTVVAEPSTALLLALGVWTLGIRGRWRSNRHAAVHRKNLGLFRQYG